MAAVAMFNFIGKCNARQLRSNYQLHRKTSRRMQLRMWQLQQIA